MNVINKCVCSIQIMIHSKNEPLEIARIISRSPIVFIIIIPTECVPEMLPQHLIFRTANIRGRDVDVCNVHCIYDCDHVHFAITVHARNTNGVCACVLL